MRSQDIFCSLPVVNSWFLYLLDVQFPLLRYEGRCGLPTNFDATYCYALGYAAGALLHSGKTGLISSVSGCIYSVLDHLICIQVLLATQICYLDSVVNDCIICLQVGNLCAPVAEWTVGGTALTSMMDVERRHG